MELLDRYLQAVRFFLPRPQQDDIIRELEENLISQMEDREEALGRPLTDDERADILRRHGHPMLVAGRYRSRRYVIGPASFPIYLFALQMGLGVALIVTIVVGTIDAVVHGDVAARLVRAFLAYPGRALMVFAWTTLSFAALDWVQSRPQLAHSWDPRTLPKVVGRENRLSRLTSLCECLAAGAALIWLLLIAQSPSLVLGPAAGILDLSPIWRTVYVPILVVVLGVMTLSVVNFVIPVWTPARSFARLAIHGGGLAVTLVLIRAGEWVVAREQTVFSDGTPSNAVADIANTGIELGLVLALVVALFEIGREIRRLLARRKPTPAATAARCL
jgi:hypothetical protein